jgi:hypothetical protein
MNSLRFHGYMHRKGSIYRAVPPMREEKSCVRYAYLHRGDKPKIFPEILRPKIDEKNHSFLSRLLIRKAGENGGFWNGSQGTLFIFAGIICKQGPYT